MKPHSLIRPSIVGCEAESQTLSTLPSPTRIISCWPSYMLLLSGLISAAAEILATHLADVTARRVHTARDDDDDPLMYMLPVSLVHTYNYVRP